MQFNDDMLDIGGDLEIKPRGVASVMQKEVRSQRLIGLLQTVIQSMLAPFIKIPNLMRELAISQDIDPDSLVNNVDEAQVYAPMLQGMMANAQQGIRRGRMAPLVSHSPAWQGLEDYLNSLKEMTVQALTVAQSESELRQLQGKMVLLETLLKLKSNHTAVVKANTDGNI